MIQIHRISSLLGRLVCSIIKFVSPSGAVNFPAEGVVSVAGSIVSPGDTSVPSTDMVVTPGNNSNPFGEDIESLGDLFIASEMTMPLTAEAVELLADTPKSSGEEFTPSGKESTVMEKGVNLLEMEFKPTEKGFEGL